MPEPYWIPTDTTGRLAIVARPRGGDWLEVDVKHWKRSGLHRIVSLLEPAEAEDLELANEAEILEEESLEPVSLSIPDRGIPGDADAFADAVAETAAALQAGTNIGIHCRQSVGRAGLFASSILVALGASSSEAIRRVSAARGVAVPETAAQAQWLARFRPPAPVAPGTL
jgi:protein-tyrosine phosphatase